MPACLKTIKYIRVDAWGGRGKWGQESWKKEKQRDRERKRGLAQNDDKNLLRTAEYDQLNSQPPEIQIKQINSCPEMESFAFEDAYNFSGWIYRVSDICQG